MVAECHLSYQTAGIAMSAASSRSVETLSGLQLIPDPCPPEQALAWVVTSASANERPERVVLSSCEWGGAGRDREAAEEACARRAWRESSLRGESSVRVRAPMMGREYFFTRES